MRKSRVSAVLLAVFALVLALPAIAGDAKQSPKPIAEMSVSPARVDWMPLADAEHWVLTVTGPGDFYLRKEFEAGQPPSLNLLDESGERLPDGMYTYELRGVARNDREIHSSGHLTLRDGNFIAPHLQEVEKAPRTPTTSTPRKVTAADQVISDELIVQSGACIGADCQSGDVDFFPGIKIKDFFTQIVFEDVADCCTVDRDWAIRINDAVGGGEYFSVWDLDAATVPFKIEGTAPDNSLYVRSNGNIGLGTSTPAAKLHLYSGATADTFASAGPDPASGPAFNFGYGGASLGRGAGFLNVRPDASATAPNPSLRFLTANVERMIITNSGNVGIGTSSPSVPLHVSRSTGAALEGIRLSNNNEARITLENTGQSTKYIMAVNNTNPALFFISRDGGGGPIVSVNQRLDAGSVASLVVTGSVQATNVVYTSSRNSKKDFKELEPQDVLARVAKLPISEWSFKEGPEQVRHIGPMAEDFHDAFGLNPDAGTISVTDTSGVALAAIQGLLQRIEELEKRNTELMDRLHMLENAQPQNVP